MFLRLSETYGPTFVASRKRLRAIKKKKKEIRGKFKKHSCCLSEHHRYFATDETGPLPISSSASLIKIGQDISKSRLVGDHRREDRNGPQNQVLAENWELRNGVFKLSQWHITDDKAEKHTKTQTKKIKKHKTQDIKGITIQTKRRRRRHR